VGENGNLVEEDETKIILMMVNESIILDSGMVWYLDTNASNHMCVSKHFFVHMQEIQERHVSRFQSKVEETYVFPKRMEKKILWMTSIMYLT